jgi:DNA-damage-inducible protein J
MANSSMNIRMDAEIKKQAQQLFASLGMDMTTAVNIFLRQAIRYNGFPFEIKMDTPNDETAEAIKEVEYMKANPSEVKGYTDVDEMMKELLN